MAPVITGLSLKALHHSALKNSDMICIFSHRDRFMYSAWCVISSQSHRNPTVGLLIMTDGNTKLKKTVFICNSLFFFFTYDWQFVLHTVRRSGVYFFLFLDFMWFDAKFHPKGTFMVQHLNLRWMVYFIFGLLPRRQVFWHTASRLYKVTSLYFLDYKALFFLPFRSFRFPTKCVFCVFYIFRFFNALQTVQFTWFMKWNKDRL